ncbi:MAG: sensor histidine kinase [Actinomycetota bacterium]
MKRTLPDRVAGPAAVATLGLPWWTFLAFAAMPVAATLVAFARDDTTLPTGVEMALLLVALVPFLFERSLVGFRYGEVIVGLAGLGALAPLLATGGDSVLLWIPGVMLLSDTALGGLRASAPILIGAFVLVATGAFAGPGVPNAPFVIAGYVVATLAGVSGQQIVRLIGHLRETEHLLAIEAARDERRRLAREIHDVIAHSMTVTLLHLQAARLACQTQSDQADDALAEAERLGRSSLDDLRRTVRLLSEHADPNLDVPVELLDDLKNLADGFANAGADVHLRISGDANDIPPVVAQALYRVAQESLTNAARHAPGSRVDIAVDVGGERISMRIENGLPPVGPAPVAPRGSGHGLRGMIERVSILGGRLEAGPTKHGWLVTGWVPREPPPGGLAL